MDFIITLFIFFTILLLYVHMNEQLQINDVTEIYEMDFVDNRQLQTICDLKQPFLFQCDFLDLLNVKIKDKLTICEENIFIKNICELETNDPIVISGKNACSLIQNDCSGQYLVDNNEDFLKSMDVYDEICGLDIYLKPYFTIYSEYDFLIGSQNVCTKLQFHKDYRQFFYVTQGTMNVKITSWKNEKNIDDFENLFFYSNTNLWSSPEGRPQSPPEYTPIDITIHKGNILYIPPYCWYSFKIHPDTEIIKIRYKTCMNVIANIDSYAKHYIHLDRLQTKMLRNH